MKKPMKEAEFCCFVECSRSATDGARQTRSTFVTSKSEQGFVYSTLMNSYKTHLF